MRIAVVGAGAVGVCCALELVRRGPAGAHEIVLIDRHASAAAECSFGNAGLLACSSCDPVGTPGIIRTLPKMLTDSRSPLCVRWRHLATLAPWMWLFFLSTSEARASAGSDALKFLVRHSVERHLALAAGSEEATRLIQKKCYIYAYPDAATFESTSARSWKAKQRRGVAFRHVLEPELRQNVPCLSAEWKHGIEALNSGFVLHPQRYVQALADQFVREGGKVVTGVEVKRIEANPEGKAGVKLHYCDPRTQRYDHVVVAAGVHAARLAGAARIGSARSLWMPLEAERGYHVSVRNPGITLEQPVFDVANGYIATPMRSFASAADKVGVPAIRFAGTVELASIDAAPDYDRAEIILEKAKRLFPAMNTTDHEFWMGRRPTLPDSLPVIGADPHCSGIHYAFGHQHVGLTGAPVTAKWTADRILPGTVSQQEQIGAGDITAEDHAMLEHAFRPTRFSKRVMF